MSKARSFTHRFPTGSFLFEQKTWFWNSLVSIIVWINLFTAFGIAVTRPPVEVLSWLTLALVVTTSFAVGLAHKETLRLIVKHEEETIAEIGEPPERTPSPSEQVVKQPLPSVQETSPDRELVPSSDHTPIIQEKEVAQSRKTVLLGGSN